MPNRLPFRRVLVANRGEIAVRVCRGLMELGIEPVAVYSDIDERAAHVLAAPHTHRLGGETALESYLDIDKIIGAAIETGCQAIHPGYGFLSENPEFAEAIARTPDLVFIGPTAESMRLLGAKTEARQAAEAVGTPVVPGFHDDDGDDRTLLAAAERIGFPVMLKASAGGGGKGMRLIDRAGDFLEAAAAARREAKAAFGDDRLLVEKRVFPARHVEIQILADHHGNVVSLHERECSVQRRHQKVLEEAPSPAVDPGLRARMGVAAVELAQHIGYRNAGTVEFLLDAKTQDFYFLEVNTRLQVEHPVTELVTGLDLVHLQLQVAAGAALPDLLADRDLTPRGHALEARIYAEDPENGFLPAAGTLLRAVEPEGPGIRVDSGVYPGVDVPVHYDPLLSKLIVHAPDRRSACRRMARALEELVYLGIPTNVDFLHRVVEDAEFVAGNLRTDFLDLRPELARPPVQTPPDSAYIAAALVDVLGGAAGARSGRAGTGDAAVPTPWDIAGPVRLWESRSMSNYRKKFVRGDGTVEVSVQHLSGTRYAVRVGDATHEVDAVLMPDGRVRCGIEDRGLQAADAAPCGKGLQVRLGGQTWQLEPARRTGGHGGQGGEDGLVEAPMTGTVARVVVKVGDQVEAGAPIIVLTAMKMEHKLTAGRDGRVTEIHATEGDTVDQGTLLARIDAS